MFAEPPTFACVPPISLVFIVARSALVAAEPASFWNNEIIWFSHSLYYLSYGRVASGAQKAPRVHSLCNGRVAGGLVSSGAMSKTISLF